LGENDEHKYERYLGDYILGKNNQREARKFYGGGVKPEEGDLRCKPAGKETRRKSKIQTQSLEKGGRLSKKGREG